ncbi:unnamed protein product [Oncorhynchus mykiss]|uniref:Uncharacterized protein n=1 Tax=Oncorhynchus mykiss TaxID=8022 RepID=A0A060VVA9_ONCMY|nr:unnamed protein product [Oncorhynchus mykiss]
MWSHAHSSGKPVTSLGDRPRLIVVKFLRFKDMMAVLKRAKNLRGTNIFLNEDCAPEAEITYPSYESCKIAWGHCLHLLREAHCPQREPSFQVVGWRLTKDTGWPSWIPRPVQPMSQVMTSVDGTASSTLGWGTTLLTTTGNEQSNTK